MNRMLERLQNGQISKADIQRLIVSQSQMNSRISDLQEHNRSITSMTGNGNGTSDDDTSFKAYSSSSSNLSSITMLGSKSNPLYMKRQTTFKEFIFALFPFLFIFWMLGGLDMLRNKKQGGGMGGMFGTNYSEWDESDWEDDEDNEEDDEITNDDVLNHKKTKVKENIIKKIIEDEKEDDRRTRFFRRLGIHISSKKEKEEKHKKSDQSNENGKKTVKKKKKKRVRFKDVCGNEEAKIDLADLVDYLKNPEKYQAMGCKLPKGVLMAGAPGTGKTLLARALAGEAGVPFLATNGASFDEIFVGVGVMRVRKLFQRAKERAPCIVFIDEIDAIANTRMQMGTAHSSDSLNALLSEMDGFEQNSGVIVIAATNMPERLDPALIRPGRFDRKVHLSLPDKKARKDIVNLYLGSRGSRDINIELLVSDISGFSGAELESMVNLASIEAVKEGLKEVSMAHLIEAKEVISMGRARRSLELPLATKKCTAYHEGGHALVSLYTKGSKPIYKATILPRGQALGFVASANADEYMTTKEALLAQLDVCMGGRAAEELFNGPKHVTTGASSDFNQATHIATAMVCMYGMSPVIGKIFYKAEDVVNLSPELQNNINSEVRRLLDESFFRAKNILIEHRKDLDLLAGELLLKETLSGDDIRGLLKWNAGQQKEPIDFIFREMEILRKVSENESECKIKTRNLKVFGSKNLKHTLIENGGLLSAETELLDPKSIDIENL